MRAAVSSEFIVLMVGVGYYLRNRRVPYAYLFLFFLIFSFQFPFTSILITKILKKILIDNNERPMVFANVCAHYSDCQ